MIFQTDSSIEEAEYSLVETRKPSNVSQPTTSRSSIIIERNVSVVQKGAVTRSMVDRSNSREPDNATSSNSSDSDTENSLFTKKEKYKNAPKSMLAVLRLTERLERDLNYKLFYDNWFSSLLLISELLNIGFHSVATVRMNRFDADFSTKTKEFEIKSAVLMKC